MNNNRNSKILLRQLFVSFCMVFLGFLDIPVQADDKLSTLSNLSGVWVPQRYVDSLNTRHSAISSSPEEITIQKEKDGSWRLLWTNFHEGSWRSILSFPKEPGNDSNYFLKVGDWEDPSSSESQHTTTWRLRVSQNGSAINFIEFIDAADSSINMKIPFVRITEPLSKYVLLKLLAGHYKDAAQRNFEFTLGGEARWPGQKFPFEVSLDHSEADCDYFYNPLKGDRKSPNAYGFRWKGSELWLFQLLETDAMPIHCEAKPFAILHRLTLDH